MWYPATISSPADVEPLTLDRVKDHCRIDHDTDDYLLTDYIASARKYVEGYCGIRIGQQTAVFKCDAFEDFARLPEGPVISVSSVSYIDTEGATHTLSTDVYEVRSDGLDASIVVKYGQIFPTIRPGSRITVTASVGYTETPETIKHAILLLIGSWYKDREAVPSVVQTTYAPSAFASLLANERRFA